MVYLYRYGLNIKTVYERGEEGKLGYDWTDIFDPKALDVVGCPRPEQVGLPWEWKIDMTFFGPNTKEEHKIRQRVPNDPNEMEIKMERSDIYKLLVDFATGNGAKIEYGVSIEGPLLAGVVIDVVAALAVEQFLPKQYSRPAVKAWAKAYDTIFTHRLKAMGKA